MEVEREIADMKASKEQALIDLKRDMRRQSDIIQQKYDALKVCFTKLRPGLLMIGEEYKQLRAMCKQFPSILNKAIEDTKTEVRACPYFIISLLWYCYVSGFVQNTVYN